MFSLKRFEEVAYTQLTVCSYKHGSTAGNRCSADPADDGGRNIRVADPDGVAFTCHALNVKADIDIVTIAFEKVVSCILTQCGVGAADTDAGKRACAYGGIADTFNIGKERMIPDGGIRAAKRVVMECA